MKYQKVKIVDENRVFAEHISITKEYAKDLVTVTEDLISVGKEVYKVKKAFTTLLKEAKEKYPQEVAKYKEEIANAKYLYKEDLECAKVDNAFFIKRMSPLYFKGDVAIYNSNVIALQEKTNKCIESLNKITLTKENVEDIVMGYCDSLINYGTSRRVKSSAAVTINRVEFIINKKGYAQQEEAQPVVKASSERSK